MVESESNQISLELQRTTQVVVALPGTMTVAIQFFKVWVDLVVAVMELPGNLA